ncbi:hypothetical protein WCLP8_5040004 [uncultured Gammaproteobacteria bacterium]
MVLAQVGICEKKLDIDSGLEPSRSMTAGPDKPLCDDPVVASADAATSTEVFLRTENAALKETVATLIAQVEELERQLGLNGCNSGKLPSSDGLKKRLRTQSLREQTGRKPGGQKGHQCTTQRQTENPDITVDHLPKACSNCGESLGMVNSVGHLARQVFARLSTNRPTHCFLGGKRAESLLTSMELKRCGKSWRV